MKSVAQKTKSVKKKRICLTPGRKSNAHYSDADYCSWSEENTNNSGQATCC